MDRKRLIKVLTALKKAAGGAGAPPVTQCVLVQASDTELHLRVTDLATRATAVVDRDANPVSARMLNLTILLKVLRALKSPEVELASVESGIEIHADSRTVRLDEGASPADMPVWPVLAHDNRCTSEIAAAELHTALAYVAPAICTDYTRVQLLGVRWLKDRVVAVDGHRLHSHELACALDRPRTIPSGAVSFLLGALKLVDRCVVHTVGDRVQFVLTGGGLEIVASCQEIEAEFPPIDQVIPSHTLYTSVDAAQLRGAFKLAKVCADKPAHGVKLAHSEHRLTVGADKFREELPARTSGGGFEIAVNPDYMLDSLSGFDNQAKIEYADDSLGPILFRTDGRFAVVMPCRY